MKVLDMTAIAISQGLIWGWGCGAELMVFLSSGSAEARLVQIQLKFDSPPGRLGSDVNRLSASNRTSNQVCAVLLLRDAQTA
jgi:hypothetical protein